MSAIGTTDAPLRVAIIGSGPAGFYVAEHLLESDRVVLVDMFERLPAPYGLVRYGVAPDHQKIKNVTRVFEKKVGTHSDFRFFGNVDIGRDLSLKDLQSHYHQVCFASGAPSDRSMGIPGEDLPGSHTATEFVAWYNGHPDYRHCAFDLSQENVVVVGVGNVAVDVARVLCRTPDELRQTDITDYALEQLAESQVRNVVMLGRRGPLQAAFTNPEVRELGKLKGATAITVASEVALDPLSAAHLQANPDRTSQKKVEILQSMAENSTVGASKTLTLRFLVSPMALLDDGTGSVRRVQIVKNALQRTDRGDLRPKATDQMEYLDAGLVFRSVGYRGLPILDVPFRDDWGTVPHDAGHVTDGVDGPRIPGLFTSGWIKRGPSGVIGTNKPDGVETAKTMLAEADRGLTHTPPHSQLDAVPNRLGKAGIRWISFADWRQIDAAEVSRGEANGRPRIKFVTADEVFAALDQPATSP